jgi:hypothetical protein
MERKLKGVEVLPEIEAITVLELDSPEESADEESERSQPNSHWISIGPFCEARQFAVHLDPRQRVVTKNLPPRFCDGRIIKRPDILE